MLKPFQVEQQEGLAGSNRQGLYGSRRDERGASRPASAKPVGQRLVPPLLFAYQNSPGPT